MLPSSLPSTVPALLTPYSVTLRDDLVSSSNVLGTTRYASRSIELDSSLSPELAWATFWHEFFHVFLFDTGLHNLLKDNLQEAFCDAFGSFMTKAQKEGWLVVTPDSDDQD